MSLFTPGSEDFEAWCRDSLVEAYHQATLSPDPSTQNGAIVYDRRGWEIGRGCNTFTRGVVVTPELLERPLKYSWIEHAERNAIFDSISKGDSGNVRRSPVRQEAAAPHVMVAAWAACADCARAIVQSGIRTLVRHQDASERAAMGQVDPTRWSASIQMADEILLAGGVQIIDVKGVLGAPDVLHSEVLWSP